MKPALLALSLAFVALAPCGCGRRTPAPPPSIAWEKTLSLAGEHCALAVREVPGGYVVAGFVKASGEMDAYLAKLDGSGKELWVRTYGGPAADEAAYVEPTSDGGYILAGNTAYSGAGARDAFLVKTDGEGETEWQASFGGAKNEEVHCVREVKAGGYVLSGWTASYGAGNGDLYIVRTDARGRELWSRVFGGEGWDGYYDGTAVCETKDGGVAVAASAHSRSMGADGIDAWLLCLDSAGNKVWDRIYIEPGDQTAQSMEMLADGGFILGGTRESATVPKVSLPLVSSLFGSRHTPGGLQVMRTDASGRILWRKTFGGVESLRGIACKAPDGGSLSVSRKMTHMESVYGFDVYLVKTDGDGELVWEATFGHGISSAGYALAGTKDGGAIVAGRTSSWGSYIVKFGPAPGA